MKEASILVLGGGVGGLTVASELARLVGSKHKITLVDRRAEFHECVNSLWAITQEVTDYNAICADVSATLGKQGVDFVKAEVRRIDPAAKTVETDSETIRADYLVIALGAKLAPELVPGLPEAGYNIYEWEDALIFGHALLEMDKGSVGVLIARTPFKCPAAPYEAAFLIDEVLRKEGVREKVELGVYTPEWQPMLTAGDEVGSMLVGEMSRRGIAYNTERMVLKVNTQKKEILFEVDEAEYDLLAVVPPHVAPDPVRACGLTDSTGWVPVHPNTLETRHKGVYAIGDLASIRLHNGLFLPMAGVFAISEGVTVARNIASQLEEGSRVEFDGEGFCYIELGGGLAAKGQGNFYARPAPKITLQPPTRENWLAKREFASLVINSLKTQN
jgi:sulfide:quinone oxidoreductase